MDNADLYILIETHSSQCVRIPFVHSCILSVLVDKPYLHIGYIKISTKRNTYKKVGEEGVGLLLLFVSYAHIKLCHLFSSSWCQELAAISACGASWTFLFTFL